MTTSIDIDFEKLDTNIASLKSLLNELDEPSYDSVEFWLDGTTGSGILWSHLVDFCDDTIRFHNAVYRLIENTITYLEAIKKVKDADQSVANSL